MAIEAFLDVPSDLREWSRFFTETTVTADVVDNDVVGTDAIQDASVTLAKIGTVTADRIIGKLTAAGSPEELTGAQVATLLEDEAWSFTGNVDFSTGTLTMDAVTIDGAAAFTANVGFYGTTPISQGAALTATLTTVTHTAPGTPDYAIASLTDSGPFGFVSQDEGHTVLSVIANLQTRVDELESRLQAYGLLA